MKYWESLVVKNELLAIFSRNLQQLLKKLRSVTSWVTAVILEMLELKGKLLVYKRKL